MKDSRVLAIASLIILLKEETTVHLHSDDVIEDADE